MSTDTTAAPKKKRPLWHWIAAGIVALVVLSMMFGGGDDDAEDPVTSAPAGQDSDGGEAAAPAATDKPAEPTAAPKATEVVGCLPVSDAARDTIMGGMSLGSATVAAITAIEVDPLADGEEAGTQWYEYAVRMAGGGLDGASLLYVSTMNPAVGDGGLVWAANTLAEKLGPWPQPDKVKNWSVRGTNDEGKHALACLDAAP